MKIQKYYILFSLVVLYFVTRLINLLIIPIFTDEAIYTYWAQVALHDPAHRFISLEDGKQPLFIWLAAIAHKFVSDPLIATRLVSVFSGFLATIGIYLLSKELFNHKVATIASFLYIILPFTLLYDRLGLFDSLLTMLGIYSAFLAVKIAKKPQLDLALISGFVLGLAMITKSSAQFFIFLLPASLIFTNFQRVKLKFLLKWVPLTSLSVFLSLVIYNALRLSELFYIISRKNLSFIRPLGEVIADPFLHLRGNLTSIITWQVDYLGLPLFAFFIITALIGILRKNKSITFLSVYILLPFFAELIFNQVLYPRFSLFYFPYVILIIAYGLSNLFQTKTKYTRIIILTVAVALLIPLYSSFKLLTSPTQANIADSDKNQYLNDWPAGYGVSQTVKILKEESARQPVYVGTEGTFGLLPYALQVYFFNNKNIQIQGFWPVGQIPQQVIDQAKIQKTFFVFNENQQLEDPRLKLVGKYQKGIGNTYMRLFEVSSP